MICGRTDALYSATVQGRDMHWGECRQSADWPAGWGRSCCCRSSSLRGCCQLSDPRTCTWSAFPSAWAAQRSGWTAHPLESTEDESRSVMKWSPVKESGLKLRCTVVSGHVPDYNPAAQKIFRCWLSGWKWATMNCNWLWPQKAKVQVAEWMMADFGNNYSHRHHQDCVYCCKYLQWSRWFRLQDTLVWAGGSGWLTLCSLFPLFFVFGHQWTALPESLLICLCETNVSWMLISFNSSHLTTWKWRV